MSENLLSLVEALGLVTALRCSAPAALLTDAISNTSAAAVEPIPGPSRCVAPARIQMRLSYGRTHRFVDRPPEAGDPTKKRPPLSLQREDVYPMAPPQVDVATIFHYASATGSSPNEPPNLRWGRRISNIDDKQTITRSQVRMVA